MTSTAQPPNPSRLYRRSSFQALLKNGARRVGYEVMFQYWSEGLIVHYRKMRDNPLSLLPADYVWDILNVHFTEMTDDKIKELLVRWRMGL